MARASTTNRFSSTGSVPLSFEVAGLYRAGRAAACEQSARSGLCDSLTYLLGRKMFGSSVGFLGGLILATSGLFMVLARAVQYDMVLTFFTTLALFLFYSGVVDEKHRRRYFLLFYVAVAFAVLAKGPLGLVLPALVIGPYLLLTRQLRLLREMQIGWGVLIVLAIASPWYILMAVRNENYLSHFFLGQNLGYFLSAESRHPEPFYFYLLVLPGPPLSVDRLSAAGDLPPSSRSAIQVAGPGPLPAHLGHRDLLFLLAGGLQVGDLPLASFPRSGPAYRAALGGVADDPSRRAPPGAFLVSPARRRPEPGGRRLCLALPAAREESPPRHRPDSALRSCAPD